MELALLAFLFGLAIGSFLNVVISRTVMGESPLEGRSKCDHCGKQLKWYHNIPLLSFLALRGRCAFCRKRIPLQYPVVEFLTGSLFVWWWMLGRSFFLLAGQPWFVVQPVFWLVVGVLLLLVFMFDLYYGIIPDWLNLCMFVVVLAYRLALVGSGNMQVEDFYSSVVAAITLTGFFGGLYLITKRKGFGLGDVKLAPSLGLLMGDVETLVAVMLAFFMGAAVAVVLLVTKRAKFGQTVPFGPFLVLGTLLSLLWGGLLWKWYWGMLGI